MNTINHYQLFHISGGCDDNQCHSDTLEMLNSCSYEQLKVMKTIFKSVVLSDALKGADDATIKNALIEAIQNTTF